MWDLLLGSEQEAKQHAGSILTTTLVRLQAEYMGTQKTRIMVHGIPVDICVNRMATFFAKYGQVDEVGAVRSKTGIATGDVVLQVVLTQRSFHDIPNALTRRDK